MLVEMLETRSGSPDGISVRSYRAGERYDLPEDLANIFLAERWAREARKPRVRKKDCGASRENKSKN